MKYTNPKNGESVETSLSEDKAAELCESKGGKFAQDIAAKYARRAYLGTPFSPAQLFWMMKLAEEIANPPEKPHDVLPTDAEHAILDMFKDVGLEVPRLRFKTDLGTVTIKAYRKGLLVTCGRAIVGNIVKDKFYYTKNCAEATRKLVKFIAVAPKEMAMLWGVRTGRCCFCFIELSTPESVTAGYGPICAERWGLPWGHVGGEKVKG